MTIWYKGMGLLAILSIILTISLSGCAGGQTTQGAVTTENLLTTAGFKRLDVNDETPKRQALLNSLPQGKISSYGPEGEGYYAYPAESSNALYVGNEVAYQKYLSLARGRNLCERVSGQNGVAFWGCMEEYRGAGR